MTTTPSPPTDALLVRNEELRSANGYAELEARLAEAVRDRSKWQSHYAVLLDEFKELRDGRLAEAEGLLREARPCVHNDQFKNAFSMYGTPLEDVLKGIDAFLTRADRRCFKCGHAAHNRPREYGTGSAPARASAAWGPGVTKRGACPRPRLTTPSRRRRQR